MTTTPARTPFGTTPHGEAVERLVLGREPGPVLHLLTLGATVHRLDLTCGDGVRRNVVLGHATPEAHLASPHHLGATIGRYANRIAHGRFVLDGTVHRVAAQDGGHHLHGGPDGFDRRVWEVVAAAADRVVLRLVSGDGDQGFPGRLTAETAYAVTPQGVCIELTATTAAPTVVNLTNHTYFNLNGDGSGTVDHHRLTVPADELVPVDATGIPLGPLAPVAGTPLDLRRPREVGRVVRARDDQLEMAGGLDHCFAVRGSGLRTHARLESPHTRTALTLRSDQPGLQVYSGNLLDGSPRSSEGLGYRQGDGLALEPELFPDSPNHPEWPSAVLRPGETYRHTIEWLFEG